MEIQKLFQLCLENWQDVIVGGVIVAWSVIFMMGIAKRLGLGKIKNKHLKRAILYFGSLSMVLPVTAMYLFLEHISFDYYWFACGGVGILMTVTYAFYENAGVRALVHCVGEKTVGRVFKTLCLAFKDKADTADTVQRLTMTTNELKEEVRRDLRGHVKEDRDLYDL